MKEIGVPMITQSISWPEISTTDVTRHNRLYACAGVRLKLGTSSWQVRFPLLGRAWQGEIFGETDGFLKRLPGQQRTLKYSRPAGTKPHAGGSQLQIRQCQSEIYRTI